MRLARASKSVSETHRLESWTNVSNPGEGQLKDHADHAIVEILDFALKPLPAIETSGSMLSSTGEALVATYPGA